MRDKFSSLLLTYSLILLVLPASYTSVARAQSLYRVELMVFAYPAEGASEQWEALPDLAYPDQSRLLIDPADQRAAAAQAANPASSLAPANASDAPGPEPSASAYVLLPASARDLGAAAASMRSSGRYRVLFHEAWLQPIPGKSAAVPIVLDRSTEGGVWPELQGTITLYQAGEFILETKLWRNTGGEYLPGTWRMPAPPRGPGSDAMGGTQGQRGAIPAAQGSVGQISDAGADNYPYRHAVLLQQSRRMRPGQVYYIDHPLLGVAVKITSLEAPASVPAGTAEIPPQSAPAP